MAPDDTDGNDTVRGALENAVDTVIADPTPEISAPEGWSDEGKTYFNSIQDQKARQWFVDQDKTWNTKLTDSLKPYEGFDDVFKPYDERIKSSNDTRSAVIGRLLQAQNILETQPVEGLKKLVEMFKIDPKVIAQAFGLTQAPASDVDPPADPLGDLDPGLRSFLTGLKTSVDKLVEGGQQQDNAAQEQIKRNLATKAAEFRDTKGADGQLLYPFMSDKRVTDEMTKLIKSGIVQVGADVSLAYKDAYERAVYTFPDLREKLQAKVDQDRVLKARRAGASPRGTGGAARVTPQVGKSVREQLQAAWDTQQEGQQ